MYNIKDVRNMIYVTQPIALGVTFSKVVPKRKAQTSNVSFARFQ